MKSPWIACLMSVIMVQWGFGGDPIWWEKRVGIGSEPSPMSPVVLGQLKNLAYHLHAELEKELPGGAGFDLETIIPKKAVSTTIDEWHDQHLNVINLGQLKFVAQPFYDRLNELAPEWVHRQYRKNGLKERWPHRYPWDPGTSKDENLLLTNLGQLKFVFSLRIREDDDTDGLPDLLENVLYGTQARDARILDFDEDGVSDSDEYRAGNCPFTFDLPEEYFGMSGLLSRTMWVGNVSKKNGTKTGWKTRYELGNGTETEASKIDVLRVQGSPFLQILRGYLIPPISGQYSFWLAADQEATFSLGEGADKFGRKTRIHLRRATKPMSWAESPTQASRSIFLEQGKRYYVEINHWAGLEDAHLSLAWSYTEARSLENWAQHSKVNVSQSSTDGMGVAQLAIDGQLGTPPAVGNIARTLRQPGSWWEIDLGASRLVDRVEIFFPYERVMEGGRSQGGYRITVRDSLGVLIREIEKRFPDTGRTTHAEYVSLGGVEGQVVRIQSLGEDTRALALAEVRILGRTDSELTYQPISIVPNDVLESYCGSIRDLDDDELPDRWESRFGFDPHTANGIDRAEDTDLDGLQCWQEGMFNLDPRHADSTKGHVTVEEWVGVKGEGVIQFVTDSISGRVPDSVSSVPLHDLVMSPGSGYRIRGYLTVPETGLYRFWIASQTGSEFWLSSSMSQFDKRRMIVFSSQEGVGTGIDFRDARPWGRFACQRSEAVNLKKGKSYFFEILSRQSSTELPHLKLAWDKLGDLSTFIEEADPIGIPSTFVSSYSGDSADSNNDGLPDTWVSEHLVKDATLRSRLGEWGDFDHDGLTNREEYLLNTNPRNTDTDADGLSDFCEIYSLLTAASQETMIDDTSSTQIRLNSYQSNDSRWRAKSGLLVSELFRGGVQWSFNVEKEGYHIVQISTQLLGGLQKDRMAIDIHFDDLLLKRKEVKFDGLRKGNTQVVTPYLSKGEHSLKVIVENLLSSRKLGVRSVTVSRLPQDPMPKWLNSHLAAENHLSLYRSESKVSPVTLEVEARRGWELSAGRDVNSDIVEQFANLPLKETGVTDFEVKFEEGFSQSGSIRWIPTDIRAGGELTIRKNDSLKLVMTPKSGKREGGGELEIVTPSRTDSVRHRFDDSERPFVYRFEQPGQYTITGRHSGLASRELVVKVKELLPRPSSVDLLVNQFREVSALDTELFYEAESVTSRIKKGRVTSDQGIVSLASKRAGTAKMLVRLWRDGPILGTIDVNTIAVSPIKGSLSSKYTNLEFPDEILWTTPLVVTNLPPGGTVRVRVADDRGAFPDGSRELRYTAADFANGMVYVDLIAPVRLPVPFKVAIYDRDGLPLGER